MKNQPYINVKIIISLREFAIVNVQPYNEKEGTLIFLRQFISFLCNFMYFCDFI